MSQPDLLAPAQRVRLAQYDIANVVDAHCHILPGIDDGPPTLAAALLLAQALVADGVTDVIATPHQLGRWDRANSPAQVRAAVAELQRELQKKEIPLRVHVGGEVRLDERIPGMLRADGVCTLADRHRHLLLELPSTLTIAPEALMRHLKADLLAIVLAHTERYDFLSSRPAQLQAWVNAGVLIQVNAGSLLGDSGAKAEAAAWEWLKNGWVSLIASDAHGVNRPPRLSDALDRMTTQLGKDETRRVGLENPRRLLEGAELLGGG